MLSEVLGPICEEHWDCSDAGVSAQNLLTALLRRIRFIPLPDVLLLLVKLQSVTVEITKKNSRFAEARDS
jgi:hypothetical protein